ncbi:hypothetical protein [Kineosporia sp. R_H_3]|uniref:hypothetical protein n=1 Tax=Kineosporia sp. R_H_3 TaxID=1961848 RepID=UPI0018E9DDD9|nr:hypothetical protein [Kineosporia sp. R_H_3]
MLKWSQSYGLSIPVLGLAAWGVFRYWRASKKKPDPSNGNIVIQIPPDADDVVLSVTGKDTATGGGKYSAAKTAPSAKKAVAKKSTPAKKTAATKSPPAPPQP